MNCDNCGAAMRFFDGRGYFWCQYCNTFAFPAGPAAGPDGVQATGGDDERSCPLCARLLQQGVVDGLPAAHCPTCRGFLMTRARFAELVRKRRALATDSGAPPTPIDPRQLERALTCPGCATRMETHPYYGPGPVVVDTCAACQLIWLDAGELSVIERAPGRR